MDANERGSGYRGRRTPRMVTRSTGWMLSWVAQDASQRFDAALDRIGITAHQLGVLSVLRAGPQTQSALSDQLAVFKPVMVTLMNELEGHGWAQRRPHPTDRRAVEVHLTDAGAAKLTEAEQVLEHTEAEIFSALGPAEREQLHQWLVRMTEVEG
jgi:DNA-binding MarR family transcriptional regulator